MSDEPAAPPTLPAGWTWVRLEELASDAPNAVTDGPFGSKLKTVHYTAGGPRVVRLQNIGDGEFVDAHAHISDEHFQELGKHAVRPGDILIAMLGAELPRACMVPSTLGPAIVKADCAKFTPHANGPDQRYLMYALNSPVTRRSVVVHGVGRPRLNLSDVKAISVPLAPRLEQDRIVAEIEKQFTRLDAAVAALKRVQVNLKRYRAAVLKAACEGRLVPTEAQLARREARSYETGEQFLLKVVGVQPRGTEASSSAPFHLPEGWAQVSSETVSAVQLGRQRSPIHHAGPNMRPYLRAGNVTWAGLDLSDVKQMDFSPDDFETFRLIPGDILLAEASGSAREVGKPAIWRGQIDGCCFQNTLIRVRCKHPDLVPFLFWSFNCDATLGRFGSAARGVGIHHLGSTRMATWPVGVPPLMEQRRIVAEIERRMSVIDQLRRLVDHTISRSSRQRQSILRVAFNGRLTPQHPRDEPASALLGRIAADHAAQQPSGATIAATRRRCGRH